MIIVISGIGMYTLMNLISWNVINTEESQTVTRAVLNAREKMDEIIADKKRLLQSRVSYCFTT